MCEKGRQNANTLSHAANVHNSANTHTHVTERRKTHSLIFVFWTAHIQSEITCCTWWGSTAASERWTRLCSDAVTEPSEQPPDDRNRQITWRKTDKILLKKWGMFTLKTYTVSLVRSCLALKTNKTHHVFCTDLFHHILSPLNHLIAHYATTLLNNWTNCPE